MQKTKIALIRGDFANPWELQNFEKLSENCAVTLFTGYQPIAAISSTKKISVEKLFSPVDLNFGKPGRFRMALLNRVFGDAHVLFGLEGKLDGFDVAHTAETYYAFTRQAINAKRAGSVKKVVSTVWENLPFNNEGIAGRKAAKHYALNNVDLFLAVTLKAKLALVEEGCDPKKIIILKPGIDLSKFKQGVYNRNHRERTRLLFAGRLEDEKGITLLLRAFREINKRLGSVELVIVGSGSRESEVRKAAKENPNITYMGSVPYEKMQDVYRSCDLLVHPAVGNVTWQEQYGMVLIEAMACGLPILSINHGSIPEVVGKGGIVVDTSRFTQELFMLIKNNKKRRELSSLALKEAKQNYDAAKFATKLSEIYTDLLKH